jgi:hypothetical protein
MLSNVKQNIETNRKLRAELYDILTKYIYKYIRRTFEKEKELHSTTETRPKLYPDFQRVLLQIPKWSSRTLEKEYNKFLKWAKKKNDIDTKDLETMLIDIIKLTTEIMLNKSSIYVETLLQDYKFPSLQQFYYKSLKKIARIIYEEPKSLYTIKTSNLTNQIENVLNIYLPTKQIESVLDFIEQDLDPHIKVKYNFENDTQSSKSSISLRKNSSDNNNLIIDKISSLHYVSSDDLHHLKDTEEDHISVKNKAVEEDNVRHINIPKIKKSQYYYNKPKINEINEYFFNE